MSDLSSLAPAPLSTTVTFLQMLRPPSHLPPMPMNKKVALLRNRSMPLHYFRYLMDRVGRRWHWVNVLRMSDEELRDYLGTPGRDIRVLHLDGAPVGFFDLHAQVPEMVELSYFGLTEDAIGQGLGRWFLGAAVDAAWSYGPRKVTVQTCTLDHPAALPLYQKLGFSPVGQVRSTVRPLSERERADAIFRP